jgi:hypothetical protein
MMTDHEILLTLAWLSTFLWAATATFGAVNARADVRKLEEATGWRVYPNGRLMRPK